MLTRPPLPFQGNKKLWFKKLTDLFDKIDDEGKQLVFVDMFGGSGIISHWLLNYFPDAIVVYNDFDHYLDRMKNTDTTNQILEEIRNAFCDMKQHTRLMEREKEQIIKILNKYNDKDIDFETLKINILYTRSFKKITSKIDFYKEAFYYNVTTTPYNPISPDDYLPGVLHCSCDYMKLYNFIKRKYSSDPETYKVVWIMDPPYLYTNVGGYKETFSSLKEAVKFVTLLSEPYILFFNSTKSGYEELINLLGIRERSGVPPLKRLEYKTHIHNTKSNENDEFLLYNLNSYESEDDKCEDCKEDEHPKSCKTVGDLRKMSIDEVPPRYRKIKKEIDEEEEELEAWNKTLNCVRKRMSKDDCRSEEAKK